MIIIGAACIIVLLAMSAFFSGSETAFVSLSRYRLKRLIIKNKSLARHFVSWLDSPQYILTAILIGNTVVNISATSLATVIALYVFASFPPHLVESSVWIVMTVLVLITGEITPKIFSRRHAEQVSLFAIRPLYILMRLIKPALSAILRIIDTFSPGLYVSSMLPYARVTADDLHLMITESGVRGGLGILTGEMMKKVLSFDQITAYKIMTPIKRIDRVRFPDNPDDPDAWERFYSMIIETGHTRIPIYTEDNPDDLRGYIHINDLAETPDRSLLKDRSKLVRPGITVSEKKKISELLKEFKTGRTHCAFILDEHRVIQGMVTLEDVLEAIVGEVLYEFKEHRKQAGL